MIGGNYLHRPDLDDFVLVYTMGKVGSTALARSLSAANIFCRHLQWLRPETQAFFDKQWALISNDIDGFLNRLNVHRCQYALRDTEYASLIKVITVIRAPIEQILSHYFQGIAVFESHLRRQNQEITRSNLTANILDCAEFYMRHEHLGVPDLTEMLCESNNDRILFHWMVRNYLDWIDQEFKPFFPVDIRGGFGGKGYVIAGNALILKFEMLSTMGEQAVGAYIQRPHFKLARENVGSGKPSGAVYQEVLSTIRFPRKFVDHLCDSKYVCQFYTDEERQDMKNRWAKQASG